MRKKFGIGELDFAMRGTLIKIILISLGFELGGRGSIGMGIG